MSKRKVKPIGTIKEELAACRAAFEKYKTAFCWCCHHEILCEPLTDGGFRERIRFISRTKAHDEKAIRFRNFRPVKAKDFQPWAKSDKRRLLNKEWPQNTWTGRSIFA